MATFEELHPDIANNPIATKYTQLDTNGKIVEAWIKNKDGEWVQVTKNVGQFYLEIMLC